MQDEISEAATQIQSSYRGYSTRKTYDLSSVSNTPRSELETTPRMGGVPLAGANYHEELEALEFREAAATDIKTKLVQIQNKASQIKQTLGQLAPVFCQDKVGASTEAANQQRPFASIAGHKDLSDLNVKIIGHTDVSEAVTLQLHRSGITHLSLLHDGMSESAEEFGRSMNGKLEMIRVSDMDMLRKSCQGGSVLILCSCKMSDRKAVEVAAREANVPWVLVEEFKSSASFRFQFFVAGVIDVLEHDVMAAPTVHHIQQSGVVQDIEGIVGVVMQHALVAFSGLIVQSVIKYWLGVGDVLGYAWYCAAFNELSTMAIFDLSMP